MSHLPEHLAHFRTLASLRPPRVAVAIAWILTVGIAVVVFILFAVPWLQTAQGRGQVVALDPEDRAQDVTALVPGRVERWYVQDGQPVKRGDPIARIVDLDPNLLSRLAAERAQVEAEIASVRQSQAVAQIDVNRTRQLFAEGLASRRDYEQAQIKVSDSGAKLAESRAKLNRIDVQLNRQSAQLVRAPRDGRIQNLNATAGGALVSAGTALAVVAPEQVERAVELMIDGRDVPLLRPGRPVRLEFEGWPAIQFSGWPSVAYGFFDGRIRSIDPTANAQGLFRILVEPVPGKPAWPERRFVRLGGKVQGWVQGETVSVGYELWRQLNDFPLEFGKVATDKATEKEDDKKIAAKAGKPK
ncbi:RND family efflux transporter MFP subunit [Sphingomonas sp. SORGH_AS 950]|uniref:efflux RND transporter periplasmic adaptor subunit n=1 Tax=unclassified Sphingomonas TaxID=196159 RepID=UPI002782DC7E|nr:MULTISPECIES: HlyD family efflux transporter periplasmic adaptor subunit [unclassified Sphingomonas]MDQ1159267.1 RND family efflux transporter MFP subunit [Sphingomonas sp. SORGH_AS_0950]MDR6145783.1 RND family efflux transporter MFP subunit [Sphingomonas sp. SORGH_AS_0870]